MCARSPDLNPDGLDCYHSFIWFRDIQKTPTRHVQVMDTVKPKNPKVELLDGPTFFKLHRSHLQNP